MLGKMIARWPASSPAAGLTLVLGLKRRYGRFLAFSARPGLIGKVRCASQAEIQTGPAPKPAGRFANKGDALA